MRPKKYNSPIFPICFSCNEKRRVAERAKSIVNKREEFPQFELVLDEIREELYKIFTKEAPQHILWNVTKDLAAHKVARFEEEFCPAIASKYDV